MIATLKTPEPARRAIANDQRLLLRSFRRDRFRSMREFAEQEIIIPSGPFEGRKFSCKRQPFARLWFDAVDSRNWVEHVITGPSQSGKSLCGFVIPIAYHICELGENVIGGVPDLDMVSDKWNEDILPVLARTRYADLLPTTGSGSKGGTSASVRFANGATLRWMTAGARDKGRAAFTARALCITETDGFDETASTSAEGSKISQLEARLRAFPLRQRRIFKECTVSTDVGHTWDKYANNSTHSRIELPCPHCKQWVSPERENFAGWQGADTVVAAQQHAAHFCPSCGEAWNEEQRITANNRARLVHDRESITLGFRWTAVNNLLLSAADVATDEWNAQRAANPELEDRKMKQFVWCLPVTDDIDTIHLTEDQIVKKVVPAMPRGMVPEGTKWITVGLDVGKRLCHWAAIAWQPFGSGHILDYGRFEVATDDLGFDRAIEIAIADFHDMLGTQWTENRFDLALVDIRWKPDEVLKAIKPHAKFKPAIGLGDGHFRRRAYAHPDKIAGKIVAIGQRYHLRIHETWRVMVYYNDANHWKTWLHESLSLSDDDKAKITLFSSMDSNEHFSFAKHLTAEREVHRFEPGRGYVATWESLRKSNHWLDATYMACVAGHKCGFRIDPPRQRTRAAAHSHSPPQFDERPFSVLDRE